MLESKVQDRAEGDDDVGSMRKVEEARADAERRVGQLEEEVARVREAAKVEHQQLVEVVQAEAVGLEATPVVETHLLKSNFFRYIKSFFSKVFAKVSSQDRYLINSKFEQFQSGM